METTEPPVQTREQATGPALDLLLEALSRRDFDAMRRVLAEDVRFRAITPPGAFELHTADEVAATFRRWFGGEDAFDLTDTSLGELGARRYARWRARLSPPGRPDESRVAEQHVFTTGTNRIETLDLLCSGFQKAER